MPRVRAGEVSLGWREWGSDDTNVILVHGNLASKDWIELAAPLFPSGLRVGPGQEHGRIGHEGNDRSLCSERLRFTGLQPRPLPRHTRAGAVHVL